MKMFLKWFGIGLMVLVITCFVLLAINYVLPSDWKLGPEILLVLAAAVLSATYTFMPGLRVQFASLESNMKIVINLVLVTVLAVLMFAFTCTGWLPIAGVVCTSEGLKTLALYVFLAIVGNQVTYVASAQPTDVVEAKTTRMS